MGQEPPAAYVRRHVRLTIQPLDAPPDPDLLETLVEQFGSDRMLLFSTDYPHWHYDSDDVLPAAFGRELAPKILFENALSTYPRLN